LSITVSSRQFRPGSLLPLDLSDQLNQLISLERAQIEEADSH
jgi:hypothetical protein